ncbi:MAG: hypothetical protein M1814_002922 [Vezdaea aestivalis]|nr:MAG: hypothetical protein M1814_002922 [Vezdaea aestivalis]
MEPLSLLAEAKTLQSYAVREATFDTVLPSTELGPQRNTGEETRSKITQKSFSGGGVIARTMRISYGWFRGKKAVLLVIQLILRSSKAAAQLRHLEVEISFKPRKAGRKAGQTEAIYPVVRNLAPRKVIGSPKEDGQEWDLQVEKQCYVSNSQKSGGPSRKGTKWTLATTGTPWSNSRNQDMNMACWTVSEKKTKPSIAIPDEITMGAIIEFDGKFQADVKVKLDLPWYNLLALPWSDDDPLLLPSREAGPFIEDEPSTRQFEDISDLEWASILTGHETSRPIPVSSEPKSTSIVNKKNPKAFRLLGIPDNLEPNRVQQLVRDLFGKHDDDFGIDIRSLTNNPSNQESGKIAVLTSLRLETFLSSGNSWQQSHLQGVADATQDQFGKTWAALDTHFDGLTPVAIPKGDDDYDLDIVALSGLGGHAYGSFRERNGEHMWLVDDLPRDFKKARVFLYGYESTLQKSHSIQSIEDIAITFRLALKRIRPDHKFSKKPMIFIAHSLGGIVLKQALIQMAGGDERDKANAAAVRGILFFGVPSQGIDIRSMVAMVEGNANENLLKSIRPDSDMLRLQHREFCKGFPYRSCKVVSFYETEESPTAIKGENGVWTMSGERSLLVGPSSASGGRSWEVGQDFEIPIKRNHSEMVKFHPLDFCYENVKGILEDLTDMER